MLTNPRNLFEIFGPAQFIILKVAAVIPPATTPSPTAAPVLCPCPLAFAAVDTPLATAWAANPTPLPAANRPTVLCNAPFIPVEAALRAAMYAAASAGSAGTSAPPVTISPVIIPAAIPRSETAPTAPPASVIACCGPPGYWKPFPCKAVPRPPRELINTLPRPVKSSLNIPPNAAPVLFIAPTMGLSPCP